jgi:erythromycin esterase-like protein
MQQVENTLQSIVYPLIGAADDYQPLFDLIGNARLVLIGEASHGTHEFYATRAMLTQRLIEEKGFNAVAAEADFPDAYRVNNYVRRLGHDTSASEALDDFKRFPTWMWRNTVVRDFVEWLREHNARLPSNMQAGFYGLDLYSLHASMEAVIKYLDKIDPEAAKRARYRYSCFEDFGEDPQAYGYAASFGLDQSCEGEVINQLLELRQRSAEYISRDAPAAADTYFYAEQNAHLAVDAEKYYRAMFKGRVSTWNLRDQHMADTLDALMAHLDRQVGRSKVAVWAHNSHIGDARATQMGEEGEFNLGQLARERHEGETILIGFSTYSGTVTAASDWGADAERKYVRPGFPGSFEALFHDTDIPNFLLTLPGKEMNDLLRQPRIQRAIGVIYRPQSERLSHYFRVHLPYQFEAMIHLDETRAVEPLERMQAWETSELPETFPTGI